MESRNRDYYTNIYIHRNLYSVFVRNNSQSFRSAVEFESHYVEVMKPKISTNKYYTDYMQKIDKEMQKFNGKL